MPLQGSCDALPRRVRTPRGDDVVVHDFGGENEGRPTLILLHANGFHGLVFQPLVEELRGSFRCLAPDLRGHGDSAAAWNDEVQVPLTFVDDVLAVAELLVGTERFCVFGHSLGGTIGLLLAKRHPGVEFLYCYEPVVMPPEGRGRMGPVTELLARGAIRRRSTFSTKAEALERFSSQRPFKGFHPQALAAYAEHGTSGSSVSEGPGAPDDATVRLKCTPGIEASIFTQTGSSAAETWRQLMEQEADEGDPAGEEGVAASSANSAMKTHRPLVSCSIALATGRADAKGPHSALPFCSEVLGRRLREAAVESRHAREEGAEPCRFSIHRFEDLDHFGPLVDPARAAAHFKASYSAAVGSQGGHERALVVGGAAALGASGHRSCKDEERDPSALEMGSDKRPPSEAADPLRPRGSSRSSSSSRRRRLHSSKL